MPSFLDLILHIDKHLLIFAQQFGPWIYLFLFLIIFCETGLVITPFLPGDSLLFTLGAFSALPHSPFNQIILVGSLFLACFLGNETNYLIGNFIGPRIFRKKKSHFFNPQNLNKAHLFYEKNGSKAIIMARFLPLVRSFVPFVAGISQMCFWRFSLYSLISGLLWVGSLFYFGYFFGTLPLIKAHFNWVIYGIVFISLLPGAILFVKSQLITRKT